jgi:hypothetical protein
MARQGVNYLTLERQRVVDPQTMTDVPPDGSTLGELVAYAVELNFNWRTGLDTVRHVQADADGGGLCGVGMYAEENIERFAVLAENGDYLTGVDRQRARRH